MNQIIKICLYIFRASILAFVLGVSLVWAQSSPTPVGNQSIYRSEIDQLLTIRKVMVLPFVDNVDGIFARPIENYLKDWMTKDTKWDLARSESAGPLLSPIEIQQDPKKISDITKGSDSDAVLAGKITKGPRGISVELALFLASDKKMIAHAAEKEMPEADLAQLKSVTKQLLGQIRKTIPYEGIVLSRQDNMVTLDMGKQDNLERGQVISAIQIIKATRHPKFHFLVNSEKEILGKIKILKVDGPLSFGTIVTEKEPGAVQKGTKISGVNFVQYDSPATLGSPAGSPVNRPGADAIYGKNPKEWRPKKPPTFGMVGARLGLGMFNRSMSLSSTGSIEANNPFYPAVSLEGELWLTSKWTAKAAFHQGIIPLDNPSSGSSPEELSQSLTSYDFQMGYRFRLEPGAWGSYVELVGGYSSYRLFVDDSQGPKTFTTLNYTGLKGGVRGFMPVSRDQKWFLGGELYMYPFANLNEDPVTSGSSSDNSINQFGIFTDYKLSEHTKLKAQIDFELYSTSFSGSGTRSESATSASQRHTSFSAGIYYLF